MSDAAPEPSPRRQFPWRTALFVSLALNLLIVGVAVGLFASGARVERPADFERAAPHDRGGPQREGFLRAIPAEKRAEVRRILWQSLRNTREQRQAARAVREEVEAIATADVLDQAALRAAFERMRAADAAVVGAWHEAVIEAMEGLSADERRAAIAAFVRERMSQFGDAMERRRRDREGRQP